MADGFGDLLEGQAFFRRAVVARPGLTAFNGEPEQRGGVLAVHRRPAVLSLENQYAAPTHGPHPHGVQLEQAQLALRLLPWIKQPFTPGYWAYTFGVTALARGVMRFADRGDDPIFTALGPVLFALANLVVLGLALRTGVALVRGRLLPGPAQPKTGA